MTQQMTPAELPKALAQLGTCFCLDTETALAPLCFMPRQARLIQFHNDDVSFWCDLATFGDDDWELLGDFLRRTDLEIYGQNLLFDYRVLYANGIELGGELYDTLVASNLIHNGKANIKHNLAAIAKRELGLNLDKSLQAQDWMNAQLTDEDIGYAMEDVRVTWRAAHKMHETIAAHNLYDVYRLECALIPAVVSMEHHGMPLDADAIETTISYYTDEAASAKQCFLETLDGRLQDAGAPGLPREQDGSFNTRVKDTGSVRLGTKLYAGFNINSSQQVLAWWKYLGIEPVDDAKKASTDKKVLARFQSDELVRMFLHYKRVEKRLGMAQKLVEHCDEDGRIRARFMPLATGTGRFSCVSGDTLLPTSRGVFRFDEYIPEQGDLVLTHKGRWMPVVRKIYKGVDGMFIVLVRSGAKLTCTGSHRLLSGDRWVRVDELQPGDALEYFPCIYDQPEKCTKGDPAIQGRGQAHVLCGSRAARYDVPQCSVHSQDAFNARGVQGRESPSILTLKSGSVEPYAGQEWFPAPQLQGLSARSQGLPYGTRWERWEGVSTPVGVGTGSGAGEVAARVARTSHRWGHHQQPSRQPGFGDGIWPQGLAPTQTEVVSITPMAPMGVWDIEVEGDHSYLAGGLFNHNSSSPNLQQVPRDPEFRCAFRPPCGRVLVQADYAAMELRVAAAIAKEERMIEAFNAGADIHTRTAALMFGCEERDVAKNQRQQAKAVNFGALYGSSAKGVQAYFATLGMFITEAKARELLKLWHGAYPAFGKWHETCQKRAMENASVRTVINRRRLLFDKENRLTVHANNEVQGTSADIMKAALIEIHAQLPPKAHLIACVHDEVIVECDTVDGDSVLAIVLREMQEAAVPMLGAGIRIKAEGGVLGSWGDK
jgi:DNA polymerase I-like protein with 3'-5' exonuclease and polymerase domains